VTRIAKPQPKVIAETRKLAADLAVMPLRKPVQSECVPIAQWRKSA
jgi:hypothetical protein